ncbi:bifunctional DNA primase/polymerase [Ruegeria arenilitoris]|uniref:bifunctional DNA primase/polymerase n=1 Tax=Ruegeria arenilitoris TaxID=1173585 RepID=UPI00147D5CDF|nr:bifunctional DNA primase/polymerase [Ruegeria arenilitoris]
MSGYPQTNWEKNITLFSVNVAAMTNLGKREGSVQRSMHMKPINSPLGFWHTKAVEADLPCFPMTITRVGDRYDKRPLRDDWPNKAMWAAQDKDLTWLKAKGYGIPTGEVSELIAFDVDSYKSDCQAMDWLHKHRVPLETRTHRTVSGGRHFIYRLPTGYRSLLRNRNGIVPGLDIRANGGCIAFGEGYEVINSTYPITLHPRVCDVLLQSQGVRQGHQGSVSRGTYVYTGNVNRRELRIKLGLRLKTSASLAMRWSGNTERLKSY